MSPKSKWAPRCTVEEEGGGVKEVLAPAADSPVYCTQLSSLDTNLHARTKKTLGDIIKIQRVCVPLLRLLLVLIVTEPHPSAVCTHVCTGADAEAAPQHGGGKRARI